MTEKLARIIFNTKSSEYMKQKEDKEGAEHNNLRYLLSSKEASFLLMWLLYNKDS